MSRPSKKINIAREQLEDGISLFLDKRYISSLTLLGSASEIFEGLIHQKHGIIPFEKEWTQANTFRLRMGFPHISKGEIRRIRNEGKNIVKHHDLSDGQEVHLDRFAEAFMMIQRAVYNADKLSLKFKYKRKYEKWFNDITNT